MKPTNFNANRHLVRAIEMLATSLPARIDNRSECIAYALREINLALDIQPDVRNRVERLNRERDCLAATNGV